jgi:hypothetical protein
MHPKFRRRIAEIYLEKWDAGKREEAAEYQRRIVPMAEKLAIRAEIRKIREEQNPPIPPLVS